MTHTGFFPASRWKERKAPPSLIPKCGACGLKELCKSPMMPVSGEGKRKILIVAEAPGADEDKKGIQLVGKTGQRAEKELKRVGIDMRRDCWLTNALICRPPGNETPDSKRIDYCRPNLRRTILEKRPHIIIPMGSVAIESLLPLIYRDNDFGGITRWAGQQIPSQKINAWVCPTYHPSYIERQDDKVLDLIYHNQLAAIAKLKGRPWDVLPTYKSQIELIQNPKLAASIIRKMAKKKGIATFDYETNCIKPDSDDAKIYSCSICVNGERTIAYPWIDEVIPATQEFLLSDIWKGGTNIKFEERWTQHEFGHGVNNWLYCTLIGSHLLDCRDPKVTGLKFQAFVQLGEEGYDDAIAPYLKAAKGKINRIHEVDPLQLLHYNAMDAVLEYHVVRKQIKLYPKRNVA